MMTTAAVLRELRSQRDALVAAVNRLGSGASSIAVTEPGGWTAKDVLAHLIHYAGQIAFGLGAPVTPPAYVVGVTERLTGQEWNERAVAYWRGFSLEEVTAEFLAITDHIIDRASVRTDEEMNQLGSIPWAGQQPLWQFIGGDTFLHEWPVHTEQIATATPIERP